MELAIKFMNWQELALISVRIETEPTSHIYMAHLYNNYEQNFDIKC